MSEAPNYLAYTHFPVEGAAEANVEFLEDPVPGDSEKSVVAEVFQTCRKTLTENAVEYVYVYKLVACYRMEARARCTPERVYQHGGT